MHNGAFPPLNRSHATVTGLRCAIQIKRQEPSEAFQRDVRFRGTFGLVRIQNVSFATAAPVVSSGGLPDGAPLVQQDPAALQAHSKQVAVEGAKERTHTHTHKVNSQSLMVEKIENVQN